MDRRDAGSGLSISALVTYSLPSAAMGFMGLLVAIYLLKFATDVLLIAPVTVGVLFGISRLWDAISDPLCGYASDRTTAAAGRRRPWILAGVLPMSGAFVMLWGPPASLQGPALTAWIGAAILLFYTGLTMVDIPHSALGAEMTDDYHARTRLFGVRRMVFGIGSLLAVAAIAAFDRLPDARATGVAVGWIATAFALPVTLFMVARTRERPEFRHRGSRHPFRAFGDVWRNPHARRLLAVFTIQQLGLVSLTVCLPFYSQYVLRTPESTFLYLGTLFAASTVGVPLWIRIAPRYEKKRVLVLTMLMIAAVISTLVFLGEGDFWWVMAVALVGGMAAAGTDVIFPSLQADVIDWDELETGQRKEGAYFASWSFAEKTAGALSSTLVGFGLAGIGFVPNIAQTPDVVRGLRFLTGLAPGAFYLVGLGLFAGFTLDRAAHDRILSQLVRRRATSAGAPGDPVEDIASESAELENPCPS